MESLTVTKLPIEKKKNANKHFFEILNTQLKFEMPKWMKKEWVPYAFAQKIN